MPARTRQQNSRTSTYQGHDLEPALDRHEWGLATYTHDRNGHPASRSFHFQDEGIHSLTFNSTDSPHHQDRRSSFTSFEGLDDNPALGPIVHSMNGTEIDKSEVFNGDVLKTQDPRVRREHRMDGGSIKNMSKVANGDLEIDAFVAFYCRQPETQRPHRAEPQSTPRAGPEHGPTPRRQSRK